MRYIMGVLCLGSVILTSVLAYHIYATFGTYWEAGPRWGLPRQVVAEDGRHFLAGKPLDAADALLIETGWDEAAVFAIAFMFVLCSCGVVKAFRPPAKPPEPVRMGLDTPLMWWNQHDAFTRRHLLNGGVLCFGRPGSGKTSGLGMTLGRAIVSDPLSAMLILAAKPEDAAMWKAIFAAAGRTLLVVDATGDWRCNLLLFMQAHGADTREIVEFIFTSAECLRGEASSGGEDGRFFQDGARRFTHHTVELIRQAGMEVSIPNIQKVVAGAALSASEMQSETWREGVHNAVLRKAAERKKDPVEQHDYEMALQALTVEWPMMADRTRSCILAFMLNVFFHFNAGFVRSLISTTTNFTPAALLKGTSILINCPSSEYGVSGTIVSTAVKHVVQKMVLARTFRRDDFYVIVWTDESWQFCSSFDQHFAATSRSHGGAMVHLAQSRDSYYTALQGKDGEHYANTLIGQFATKVFHALGSADDAQYASSLLGHRKETFVGSTTHPTDDVFDAVWKPVNPCISTSQSYQPILQPGVFLNGLRTNGGVVDAIVIRSGEPFSSTGENFLFTTFKQG